MIKKLLPDELTVPQFAEALKVSHDMVTRWVHAGKIKSRKTNPFSKRSPFLIPASELERVKKLISEGSGNGNGPSKSKSS